jgi:hypothetical protein
MNRITFISLGEACDVKYQLEAKFKEHNNIQKTYFFDWIISDFKTVLSVLNGDFLKKFTKSNLLIDNTIKKYSSSLVTIKNFSTFTSLHDIPKNYDNKDIDEFIDKYTRRYYRFINLIRDNNEKMFFLRNTKEVISNRDVVFFNNYVKKINPFNKVYLVILCNYIPDDYQIKHGVILVNYERLKLFESKDWKANNYNWDFILKLLLENF